MTKESHPNILKSNQHTKEGFSLFSLLDRTKSKVGKQKLREILLKPLYDKNLIIKRQDIIESMVSVVNLHFQSVFSFFMF